MTGKYDHIELPDRAHSLGCPAKPARIERFEAFQDVQGRDELGQAVTRQRKKIVVRCITCGGQIVLDAEEAMPRA